MGDATTEAGGGITRVTWAWFLAIVALLLAAAAADRWLIEAVVAGRSLQIDPQIYYCSALAHEQGLDPYRAVYPPGCFDGHFRFVYPPAVLELFAWLRPTSLAVTRLLLVGAYLLAFGLLAWGLGRLLWPRLAWPALLAMALLANPSTLGSWSYFGNIAILLYALLLGGCLALLRWPARGPALLVAAVVVVACIKWILLVYLLPLILAEGRRGLRWSLVALLFLALLYGIDAWRAPEAFRGYLAAFESHRAHVDLGMGIPTFGFDLLEAFAGVRDLSDRAEWLGRLIWLCFALALAFLAWRAAPRLDRRHRLLLGLLLAGLLLPRVKTYDWYLLLPVALYFVAATRLPAGPLSGGALLWSVRLALAGGLLLLPVQTAFYAMVLGTLAWLLALARGWILLRQPDPAALVPPPLDRWLLRRPPPA